MDHWPRTPELCQGQWFIFLRQSRDLLSYDSKAHPSLTCLAKLTRPWQHLWAPLQKSGTHWGACGRCSHHKLDFSSCYLCNSVNCGRMLAVSKPSSSYCQFQGHNSGKQNQREKFKTINNVQNLIITQNRLSHLNNSYASHKTLHDLPIVLISPTWATPAFLLFLPEPTLASGILFLTVSLPKMLLPQILA